MADLLSCYLKWIGTSWKWLKSGIEMPLNLLTKKIRLPHHIFEVTTFDPDQEVEPSSVGMTGEGVAAIWRAVEDLYRTGLFPGIAFCLRRHGKILLNRSIGHARGNGPGERDMPAELLTPETPVCIFSCSKAVTAMLVHLLSERCYLGLLDPVSHYLPEFGQNGKKDITIFQLLCHQAGIHRLPLRDVKELKELIFNPRETVRRLCAAKADRPGYHTAYHAFTAGMIIGEIVHRITGRDCREFLAENIQRPMGLTYFNYGIESRHADKAAKNYITGIPVMFPWTLLEKRILGVTLDQTIEISNDPRFQEVILPAGNMFATADECTRFFQLLLDDGVTDSVRIFNPLTIQRATKAFGKVEIDRTFFMPIRYSAGMMLGDSPFGIFGPNTREAFGHFGITNNACWADPKRAISVAILTTGKALLGLHLPKLMRLFMQISKHCSPYS